MAGITLFDYQEDAIKRMHNGCVLCGGVGSGKSRTAIAYYYIANGGEFNTKEYIPMDDVNLPDLVIITTARKRDTCEWELELVPFLLSTNPDVNLYRNKVVIDSWNNIKKYSDKKHCFFIFDEQRVVGSGVWVDSFLKIAKNNEWILLSATPGDTWSDYIPVFIANGFYKNRTQFYNEHAIFARFAKYPRIERYWNVGKLIRLREKILVDMDFERKTIAHHEYIITDYNRVTYNSIMNDRWNVFKNEPIKNAAELCGILRQVVNLDPSRFVAILKLVEEHPRSIIFYNYDYELYALMDLFNEKQITFSQWNGLKHEEIPDTDSWVYLVQYNAGAEGWNCIKTDTIIFFSQNYSYKILAQACGRIDRLNTPYTDLYFYHLKSKSSIDNPIFATLKNKKSFSERRFFDKKFGN